MPILTRQFDLGVHGAAELVRGKDRAVLLSSGHSVVAIDLQDGATRELANGYAMPAGLAASADGTAVFVMDLDPAQTQFTLYRVEVSDLRDRNEVGLDLEAGQGVALLHGVGTPGQIAVDGEHLYYADRVTGDLVAIQVAGRTEILDVPPSVVEVPMPRHAVEAGRPLAARETTPVVVGGFGHRPELPVRARSTVLAGGLQDPIGVCVDPGTRRIFVTEHSAGRVVSIAAGESSFTVEHLGTTAPQMLSVDAGSGALLVPGFAAAGTVEALTPSTHDVERIATLTAFDHPLYVLRVGDRLACIEARGIRWWDIFGRPQRPVTITLADTEPFIGSYQRVQVDLGTSGIAFTDLEFVLDAGDEAGRISYSRDDLSAANEIMLLVGYQPGKHTIKAIDTSTSATVASADYEITDKWTSFGISPARWSIGELASFQTGYTWGGGPSTPQNVDVFPQSGTRHICMLMVDVSDALYPTGSTFDTLTQTWRDGAVGPAPSARTYYEEVSHGGFTLALSGSTVPHVQLSTSWSDNFSTMPTPWPSNSFQPNDGGAFAQACISAAAALTDGSGNPLVDFGEVQSLILVIRSKGSGSGDDFFWAQAWGGSFTIPGGSRNMNVLGMPDDWVSSSRGGGRTIYETLSHEMGHNLGYPDLYTNVPDWNYSADIQSRDIADFDLMSAEAELPHMSIAQKMETGWVRPAWIRMFDFSRSTIPLSQTVTLNAVEAGAPPAGQFAGIEIRIADGWNYYFEYRKGQTGQIGDQELASNPSTDTGDGVVLGTDVLSQSFTYPIARPQIIRLRPDAEGEHSFFSSGQDYKETDNSSTAIADFKLTVLSTSGNTAQVKVEYGTNGRPDLYIRPWPGGNDYQSPDIEVRNARSMADPAHWTNVPWAEHANTVIARYRNRGPVTCQNVKVDFYVKDYTVSNAPEVWIGSDTQDVPPESTTAFIEFTAGWVPPDEGHRCIIVRTPLYIDTSVNPNIVEVTDTNNSAQSNYTQYISASSSPAKREITSLTLHNPYDTRAEMYVIPQITGPFSDLYRLYLEHTALMLDPGESRPVQVMVESLYGDPHSAGLWREKGEKIFYDPTKITFTGYGIPPESTHPQILGGAEMTVGSGHATKFTSFGGDGKEGVVRGAVEVVDSGGPATGFVLVTFHGPDETVDNTVRAPLDQAGRFFLRGTQELVKKLRATKVSAHYPGRPGYAPSDAPNVLEL